MEQLWHGYRTEHFTFEGRDAVIAFPGAIRPGAPWLLKTEYWDAFPDVELRLLEQGFHVAFLQNHNRWATREECDAKARFVRFVTETYDLNSKCIPIGMSCGGAYAVKFAGLYPELVQCMYIDAPVLNFCSIPGKFGIAFNETLWEKEFIHAYSGICRYQLPGWQEHPICQAASLRANRIPVLLVYGKEDATVPYEENGRLLAEAYHGTGLLRTIAVNARGHHPHGLIGDNQPIVDFILTHA